MVGFLDRMYQISKIANLIEESSNGFLTELKQKDTASPCLYIKRAYAIRPYIKIIDRRDACPTVLYIIRDCFVAMLLAMKVIFQPHLSSLTSIKMRRVLGLSINAGKGIRRIDSRFRGNYRRSIRVR